MSQGLRFGQVVRALNDSVFKRLGMEGCLMVVFVVSERRASPTGSQNSQVDWNVVRIVSGGWTITMQL
jgi:hypothetical protein